MPVRSFPPLAPPLQRSSRRRQPGDDAIFCGLLETAVASAFNLPVTALRTRSRGPAQAAFARQCAMYLAHVVLCLNYGAVGRLFHRDRTTAAYACKQVEARRDDPGLDRMLQSLEELCDDLGRQWPALGRIVSRGKVRS